MFRGRGIGFFTIPLPGLWSSNYYPQQFSVMLITIPFQSQGKCLVSIIGPFQLNTADISL